jgi:ribosomal protein S18 acetylase RimI-like enzyme
VISVLLPKGFSIVPLEKRHKRAAFSCGEERVDEWLKKNARQSEEKRLSVTRVMQENSDAIVGYYTLAMGQVNFDELPHAVTRKLPSTMLPIVTLAWLGVDGEYQGRGLGDRLFAQALAHCHATGGAMPFVAVILDCLGPRAKAFYQRFDFKEIPGHPMKLMLPWSLLDAMMRTDG